MSERQTQVLKLRAEGFSPKQIGVKLGIAEVTAWYHLNRVYKIVGFSDVALLTQWALKHGIANWKV